MQAAGDTLEQHFVDQRRLARPRHPRHAREDAERDLHVDVAQVVLARALDLHVAARRAPLTGRLDRARPRQELARRGALHPFHLLRGALRDDLPTVHAGAGAHVDEVVGRAHRLLVVLDHDHRIAEVTQALQSPDQLRVVALVQPDRGLVEDVQHAHQRRPDLCREADPLRLPPGEGRGGAVHRQVADPDVLEELQPLGDLPQNKPRHVPVGLRQLDLLQPLERPPRGQCAELIDRRPRHKHRARLGAQPRSPANRAGAQRHELLDLLFRPLGLALAVAALQALDDALKARRIGACAPEAIAVGDRQPLVGAVQEQLAHLNRQLLPRLVEVDAVAFGNRLGHLLVVVRRAARPGRERPLDDRQRGIGHDQLGVDLHLRAQPGAVLTRAVGGVEREDPRLELDQRRPVHGAGEALREGEDRALLGNLAGHDLGGGRAHALCAGGVRGSRLRVHGAHDLDLDQPFGEANRGLDRVRQSLAQVVAHHQPVDHDRDVVLVALVEHDRFLQHPQPLVDLHAREAVRAQLLQELAVLALAPAHHWGEHHEAGPLPQLHHLVNDLLRRLPDDRPPADGTVGLANTRPQQPQVVVDLRDRADRRARVARGRLLIDRDRRREPLDRIHVGLVHLAQELARVGRQRLDITSLPLGVDRVERQAALARAGQPRDHDERISRQRQRDVLEVVLPRPRDDDLIAYRHVTVILLWRTDVRSQPMAGKPWQRRRALSGPVLSRLDRLVG